MSLFTIVQYVASGILLCGLTYGISRLRIGKIESYPYRNTVYVDPSRLNTMLKPDGKTGVCAGMYYVALYQNKLESNNSDAQVKPVPDKSTVYYLASVGTVSDFNKEFYYNKPGTH